MVSLAMWLGWSSPPPLQHTHNTCPWDPGVPNQTIPFCWPPVQQWTCEPHWTITLFSGLFLEFQVLKTMWALQGTLLSSCEQRWSENEARDKRERAKDLVTSSESLDPVLPEAGQSLNMQVIKANKCPLLKLNQVKFMSLATKRVWIR